jgi:GNAT superfamily N-acetyltransferase
MAVAPRRDGESMDYDLRPARPADADALAELHTASWRSAYRGLLPDAFLDGPIEEERRRLWRTRLNDPMAERRLVLKAMEQDHLIGFVCVLLDSEPEWGPCVDNLHVKPALRGKGIGHQLFDAARSWSAVNAPGQPMHLWVIEGNLGARRFYERLGGVIAGRSSIEVVKGIHVPELRYVWYPDRP